MKTVINAMRILDALLAGHENQKVNELAEQCGLNPITTYKILSDLTAAGLVCKTHRNSRYGLGETLLEAPRLAVERTDLHRIALPHLEELALRCEQSVNLLVLVGRRGYYAEILNPDATDNIDRLGQEENLFLTSLGRAILAYLPEETVREMAEAGDVAQAELESLWRELTLVRKHGFAVQDGLVRENSRGVSAPVFSSYGAPIGAVCVAGLAEKISITRLLEYSDLVRETAAAITRSLQAGSGQGARVDVAISNRETALAKRCEK